MPPARDTGTGVVGLPVTALGSTADVAAATTDPASSSDPADVDVTIAVTVEIVVAEPGMVMVLVRWVHFDLFFLNLRPPAEQVATASAVALAVT